MTALFFISQGALSRGLPPQGTGHRGTGAGRRIDLASIAQLFAEPDAPPPPRVTRRPVVRLAMLALILLGVVGDVVFVAKPGALSTAAGIARSVEAFGSSAPDQA